MRSLSGERTDPRDRLSGVKATACRRRRSHATRETPGDGGVSQPDAREGQAGSPGESERFIVPKKPLIPVEGRDLSSRPTHEGETAGRLVMSLIPPPTVEKLRQALHAKAKRAPEYRFYALYDKVYRADVLAYAYACGKAKGGAAGVDGQTFEDIETYGLERWLGELTEALRKKTYRPQAVRRKHIPKPDGGTRPLGIPTVTDRVVQTAVVVVLGAIFEADMPPEQYAYRPGRSALEAVRRVQRWVIDGHTEVVDADLSGYFDSIPHAELMKSVARRVSDRHLLGLIKAWLQAPVEEEDSRGRKHRTTRAKDTGRGVPQGAPLSPLLANLYMRRFILGWKVLGHERELDAHIVNYADDFVICCRGTATEASARMRAMIQRLRLAVNEQKTRVVNGANGTFDFLGYTIGRCYAPQTGHAYIGVKPAAKSIHRLCRAIHAHTDRRWLWLDPAEVVARLNPLVRGWGNYFCLGTVAKAYQRVNDHLQYRLRQWLVRKHQGRGRRRARDVRHYLYQTLGLYRLQRQANRVSWATA
jgi:RNA-directed DNA polymerase